MEKAKTTPNFVEHTSCILGYDKPNVLSELIIIANYLSDEEVKKLISFAESFLLTT